MGGARHLRRRPFELRREMCFFRVLFCEMSLKHSACHTFRASGAPCNTPKSHLKSRKIDFVGDHISGKKQSKSVAGAVKEPPWKFVWISGIPFGSFGLLKSVLKVWQALCLR